MKVYGSINTESGGEISTTPATPSITSNSLTLDCSTANIFVVQHNANINTLNVTNQQDGQSIAIILNEVGSGRTVTWPSNFFFVGPSTIDAVNGQINQVWATYSATLSTWVAALESNNGGVGTGTVTSVALSDGSSTPIFSISGSPVTTSGTLTFTLNTESANTVFAGPTSGGASQPTFRSLVVGDLPAADYEEQVATASQTVFNTTIDTVANGGGKTYLAVYVNGVYQQQGATKSYTVTGANQITFNAGLSVNSDVVLIQIL
jgi:hypothetical protein